MVLLPVIHAMGGSERCLLLLATKIGLSGAPLLPLACEKLRNAGLQPCDPEHERRSPWLTGRAVGL
jgi:hypothetical protein